MALAIVLAAGKGSRMKSEVAKQYIELKGKEVLYYSLKRFQDNDNIDAIILVTRDEDIEYCQNEIVNKYGFTKVIKICTGGKERYNSVYEGLKNIQGIIGYNKNIVMIHDGARPFVTDNMINDSIKAANEFGACTVAMPVKDTIKIIDENKFGIETPDRRFLYQIQTPQTFKFDLLFEAYNEMLKQENYNITDDTMLVEQYKGVRSKMVDGAYENIKITTPDDIEIAEKFIEKFF